MKTRGAICNDLNLNEYYSGHDPKQHLRDFNRRLKMKMSLNVLESSRDDLQEYAIKNRFHFHKKLIR